jgi:hypothetical protein
LRGRHVSQACLPPQCRRVPPAPPPPCRFDRHIISGLTRTHCEKPSCCTASHGNDGAAMLPLLALPVPAMNQEREMQQAGTTPRAAHGEGGWSYGKQT